jgi:hypothetical protein
MAAVTKAAGGPHEMRFEQHTGTQKCPVSGNRLQTI